MAEWPALQPSLSTGIFGKRPLAEVVGPIARAGFRQIEISRRSRDWAEGLRAVRDAGLRVWAVHGRGVFFLDSSDEAACRKVIDAERRAMDEIAPCAPCPYVFHFMRLSKAREGDAPARRRVGELLEHARQTGLTLALEPLPPKLNIDRYVGDAEVVAALARSFESPHLAVCLDSNHSNLGEDLCGAICDCAGLIANVHLSDNLGVTDDHLPPGEGTIDWPGALRALGEAGYSGAVNLEIHWADTPPAELLVRLREWAEGAAKMVDAARWHRNQTTATANGSHGFRSTRSTASGMAADYDDDNDFLTADERGWTRIRPRTMFRGKRNT